MKLKSETWKVYSAQALNPPWNISPKKRPRIICFSSSQVVSPPANESVAKFTSREKSILVFQGWEWVEEEMKMCWMHTTTMAAWLVVHLGTDLFIRKIAENAKRSFSARPKIL